MWFRLIWFTSGIGNVHASVLHEFVLVPTVVHGDSWHFAWSPLLKVASSFCVYGADM